MWWLLCLHAIFIQKLSISQPGRRWERCAETFYKLVLNCIIWKRNLLAPTAKGFNSDECGRSQIVNDVISQRRECGEQSAFITIHVASRWFNFQFAGGAAASFFLVSREVSRTFQTLLRPGEAIPHDQPPWQYHSIEVNKSNFRFHYNH
jgi:hypothetical protein